MCGQNQEGNSDGQNSNNSAECKDAEFQETIDFLASELCDGDDEDGALSHDDCTSSEGEGEGFFCNYDKGPLFGIHL